MSSPFDEAIRRADEIGLRLEVIDGVPVWETSPVKRHQSASFRIQSSIRSTGACECAHYADVYIEFPDGSLKRPDIAIFCEEPKEEDEAITAIPVAVVEIISKNFEKKDLEIAPGFYLAQGVKDIIIFDPRSLEIWHHRADGVQKHASPHSFSLSSGCTLEV
jgi:Uma2 family endonuclease